jgi:hypothetical protein
MNKKNIYLDKIKNVLPKNMKKEKIEIIEDTINEILKLNDDFNKHENIEKITKENNKYINENIQLKLDNLKLHEENIKKHKLILKLHNNNEELNESNEKLSEIAKQFENMNLKNNVGIYSEE